MRNLPSSRNQKEGNPSAARSLDEALEEILTLHRLDVPSELRRVLSTTNGIENLFSVLRHREKNVKNYNPNYKGKPAKKGMSQRWLATCLLNAETGFNRVKGYADVSAVVTSIRKYHQEIVDDGIKKVG